MPIDITTLTVAELLDLQAQMRKLGVLRLGRFHGTGTRGTAPQHDYASWDWTKTNTELVKEHGVTVATVCNWRRRLGKERVTKHWPACKNWDWSKSDTEISRETGAALQSIRIYRARLGHPAPEREPAPNYRIPRIEYDWSKADWTKHDVAISKDIGCSRERVRQMRAQLGQPKMLLSEKRYQEFLAKLNGRTAITSEQFPEFNAGDATIRKWCARANVKLDPRPHNWPGKKESPHWKLMNWNLPNAILSEIWRLGNNRVGSKRYVAHNEHPLWRSIRGRIPPEHLAEVETERAKAQAYFDSQNGTSEAKIPSREA